MTEPRHDTATVSIEKLVYGGDGLSRTGEGVVLTPYTLPGETVEVQLRERRGGLTRAVPLAVRDPHPARTTPSCPYFGRCGGCQYQHSEYAFQATQKAEILREVLERVGKLHVDVPIDVVTGDPWQYRNRSQFHIQGDAIGYHERDSHRLVGITHCPISSPKVNEVLAALLAMLPDRRFPRFVRSLEVFTNESDVHIGIRETEQPVARRFFDWCAERIPGFVEGALDYPALGEHFRVSGDSFFQVNRFLVDELVAATLDGLEGETAFDLYAGVGLFSLALARRGFRVQAVETGPSAVRDLKFNARRAGIDVGVSQRPVEEFLLTVESSPDVVIVDPPRAGIGVTAAKTLSALRPRQIVFVACDPSTLARDLVPLIASGYVIRRLAMVDLFPHTLHLESVVLLQRP